MRLDEFGDVIEQPKVRRGRGRPKKLAPGLKRDYGRTAPERVRGLGRYEPLEVDEDVYRWAAKRAKRIFDDALSDEW